jgi:hypothetical protein
MRLVFDSEIKPFDFLTSTDEIDKRIITFLLQGNYAVFLD